MLSAGKKKKEITGPARRYNIKVGAAFGVVTWRRLRIHGAVAFMAGEKTKIKTKTRRYVKVSRM